MFNKGLRLKILLLENKVGELENRLESDTTLFRGGISTERVKVIYILAGLLEKLGYYIPEEEILLLKKK